MQREKQHKKNVVQQWASQMEEEDSQLMVKASKRAVKPAYVSPKLTNDQLVSTSVMENVPAVFGFTITANDSESISLLKVTQETFRAGSQLENPLLQLEDNAELDSKKESAERLIKGLKTTT